MKFKVIYRESSSYEEIIEAPDKYKASDIFWERWDKLSNHQISEKMEVYNSETDVIEVISEYEKS